MEKIKVLDNKIVLKFNSIFYERKFINQAALDFSEVCESEQTTEGIILKPKGENEPEIVGYEFYNYVLGLIKNQ